jgi:hypothetical protein
MTHAAHRAAAIPHSGHGVPTVLLIEPVEVDHRAIRDVLEDARGILDLGHVTTITDGIARLAEGPVSTVLPDLNLAGGARPERLG